MPLLRSRSATMGPYLTPAMVMPVASLSRSAWVTLPNSRARYLRTQPDAGISSRRAISPSLVRSNSPSELKSSRPTDTTRPRMFGQVGEDGGPAFFVLVGGDQARRLVIAPQPRGFGLGQRLAVHLDRHCFAVTLMAGVVTISPSSFTRPSAISFSASRREQMPGAGDDFCDALAFRLNAPPMALRMNDDEAIALALDEAKAAAARGEVPVGAVLLSADGALLARDGNRILELKDPTAHAEMLVLRAGAQALGNERLLGTTLSSRLEPCAMCAGAIALARVARAGVRRGRSQGRRGAAWPALFRAAHLPSPSRWSRAEPHAAEAGEIC